MADLLTEEDWQAIADNEHHGLLFIPGALKEAVEERIRLRLAALGVAIPLEGRDG